MTTASAGGWRWLARSDAQDGGGATKGGLEVTGRALFPGVMLEIHVDAGAPAVCSVRTAVRHAGQTYVHATESACPGSMLALETPYPYDDLVPGLYEVSVDLLDAAGRVMERHDVGGYQLAPHWFSA